MAFTVGDLRRALEGVPDETPVALLMNYDEIWYRNIEGAKLRALRTARNYEPADWILDPTTPTTVNIFAIE